MFLCVCNHPCLLYGSYSLLFVILPILAVPQRVGILELFSVTWCSWFLVNNKLYCGNYLNLPVQDCNSGIISGLSPKSSNIWCLHLSASCYILQLENIESSERL